MTKSKGRIEINEARCKGCGLCVSVCPNKLLHLKNTSSAKGVCAGQLSDYENCSGCRFCAFICPDVAIEVYIQEHQN